MSKNHWQNWSGIVQFNPQKIVYPHTEEEIIAAIKKSVANKQELRVVGSGHSWTPLVETDHTLMSLDNYQGVVHIDKEKRQATVKAGTKLKYLGKLLFEQGLAMENLGDIDVQAIAGAISTGTHGTGIAFGIIPTQIVALRLITASGEIISCSASQNADIFKAAQVSLGALGVISHITLRCVPAYKLKYVASKQTVADCLQNLQHNIANNRNYEFYWFPHTDTIQPKCSNLTNEAPIERSIGNFFNDYLIENGLFGAISTITRIKPNTSAAVARLTAAVLPQTEVRINWSHKVYATPRLVKFNEMEYNIPIEHFEAAFNDIRAAFEGHKFEVHFPIECRFLKGDDIWLSPAYGRDSAHISLHVFKGKPYQHYFNTCEAILQKYNGRPHWGKMHNCQANKLSQMYPHWNDFLAIRQQLDPQQLFINGYLRLLFGLDLPKA